MTNLKRVIATTAAALVLGTLPIPATADGIDPPPDAHPAAELPPDPTGCYRSDGVGGTWPCYYVIPDFCLDGQTTAYHAVPCEGGDFLTKRQWCAQFATHPYCDGVLPPTGYTSWLLWAAVIVVLIGCALFGLGRHRRP